MAKVDWLILCERAIVESQTNTVSLFSLLETVNIPSPPPDFDMTQDFGVPMRFYAVQQWHRASPKISERIPARVVLVGPNKKISVLSEFIVDLATVARAFVVSGTFGFPFGGLGNYKCRVQAQRGSTWRTLRETEFNLAFVPMIALRANKPARH